MSDKTVQEVFSPLHVISQTSDFSPVDGALSFEEQERSRSLTAADF